MKIAYFLGLYKDMEQASRLLERIYTVSDYFYININIFNLQSKCAWEKNFENYKNKKNVIFIFKKTNRTATWGSFNLTKWTFEGMTYFSSFDYDYFINLTGHCYPIKPMSEIKEELGKKNAAYMEYFALPVREIWEGHGGLDRINYNWINYGDRRFIRFPRFIKKLPNDLKPYGGSTYFCLQKKFVDYLLEYVFNNPKIVRFYKYSFIPDEMFFQTIIMNSPLASEVVNDNKRYIDWEKKNVPLPAILTEEDFDKILRSDKLFARKFDLNTDKKILDLIDKEIQYFLKE